MSDYDRAVKAGLTTIDRWGIGREHHPKSVRMMEFLKKHDWQDYGGFFDWSTGGDGDNGETLMFQMDALFELMDKEQLL